MIRRNAALYSGRRNEYQEGELVWYLCPRAVPGKPLKWTQQWTGPFRITQVVSEVLIKIRAIAGLDRELTVHLSRIRPYVGLVNPSTRVPATLEVNPRSPVEADEIHGCTGIQHTRREYHHPRGRRNSTSSANSGRDSTTQSRGVKSPIYGKTTYTRSRGHGQLSASEATRRGL